MFKALKCRLSGHIFVDSRSQPGVQVCVRCRHRKLFEGLSAPALAGPADALPRDPRPGDSAPAQPR